MRLCVCVGVCESEPRVALVANNYVTRDNSLSRRLPARAAAASLFHARVRACSRARVHARPAAGKTRRATLRPPSNYGADNDDRRLGYLICAGARTRSLCVSAQQKADRVWPKRVRARAPDQVSSEPRDSITPASRRCAQQDAQVLACAHILRVCLSQLPDII